MRRALLLVAVMACKSPSKAKHEEPQAAKVDTVAGSDDDRVVQPRFSNGVAAPTQEGRLPFTITKVTPEGETFTIEAHVTGDPEAKFAVRVPKTGGDGPGFAKMHFIPTTHEAGARVVTLLAKTLGVNVPPVTGGGELQPLKVPTATLGHNIGMLDNGMGGRGTWDATKLFCSAGSVESAELFFNYSIAEKRGEFSEKDTDYNQDVVACLTLALRDGLPPPRTPANDPTLSLTGPRIEIVKQLGKTRMEEVVLAPSRILRVDERGAGAALVEIDAKTGAMKDLYTTPDRLEYGKCTPTVSHCVIKASTVAEDRNTFGGGDKTYFLLLVGSTVTRIETTAFGDHALLTARPLSPDGRLLVLQAGYGDQTLTALNLATKQVIKLPVKAKHEGLQVMDWVKEGDRWIALVERNPDITQDRPSAYVDWHVEAKGITKPSKRAVPALVPATSPDGKRRADWSKPGTLTIIEGDKSRTLTFHPDDAKNVNEHSCPWIDNRFMWMTNGFIDTDTMKVSLLPGDRDDFGRIEIVPGTRTAIIVGEDGTHLASIVGP